MAEISKSTPYEKLRSISFGASEADASRAAEVAPSSALEGAVMQAMSGIAKGGKVLTKGTAIGVAASGLNQLASNAARKSNLIIATDVAIHTLTNQQHNGWMKVSRKEHDAVALALIEAGNGVLGISPEPEQTSVPEIVAVAAVPAAAPSLSDRLRELSELHREGILSDQEFASAKGKLLGGI
ncbi:SHOCT domain-containing protein [Microbacterium aerolatum]|uniref:SHOCT domain-containing protein n=1 Tax=Microbacterium aerolatum TaxID=153731 RepID=UPI001E401D70|nr:SHOCT domain-containing protein [Microbacterium aerolatum]